jgi:hypothetical protein
MLPRLPVSPTLAAVIRNQDRVLPELSRQRESAVVVAGLNDRLCGRHGAEPFDHFHARAVRSIRLLWPNRGSSTEATDRRYLGRRRCDGTGGLRLGPRSNFGSVLRKQRTAAVRRREPGAFVPCQRAKSPSSARARLAAQMEIEPLAVHGTNHNIIAEVNQLLRVNAPSRPWRGSG